MVGVKEGFLEEAYVSLRKITGKSMPHRGNSMLGGSEASTGDWKGSGLLVMIPAQSVE